MEFIPEYKQPGRGGPENDRYSEGISARMAEEGIAKCEGK
jgi:hypothetical protein